MRRARTYPWIRIRPYRVLLRGQGVFFAARSLADCITNMSGFDLRQAQRGYRIDRSTSVMARNGPAAEEPACPRSEFDPEQNSPPDNASIAERIQCRRRHRVESVGRRRPNCRRAAAPRRSGDFAASRRMVDYSSWFDTAHRTAHERCRCAASP